MNEMDKIAFSGAAEQSQFAMGPQAQSALTPPQQVTASHGFARHARHAIPFV
jgi:hypothetical protein